jgi:SAM-dependent methyltransferase
LRALGYEWLSISPEGRILPFEEAWLDEARGVNFLGLPEEKRGSVAEALSRWKECRRLEPEGDRGQMRVGVTLGAAAKRLDSRFGILAWLRGEPRPPAGGFDLEGEKFIDWGWICVNLPRDRKRALEIGPGESPIIPAMLALGYEVAGVDLLEDASRYLDGFRLVIGDFNEIILNEAFDVIVACSTIEHIGLSGRFGSGEDPEGDLKAMRKIASLLSPDGVVFLTIPVGVDATYKPWHRVYGRRRISQLLDGFEVVAKRFLVKSPWGPWRETSEDNALEVPADIRRYALGEMILRWRR